MVETPRRQRRLTYAVLLVVTLILGLGSRHVPHLLPSWLAKSLGDVLYATFVFWLMRFLSPDFTIPQTALTATVFCFLIEFSQLYQAPWIVQIRHTRLGGLVLGYGFHPADLLCYVVGVGLGVVVETALRRRRGKS